MVLKYLFNLKEKDNGIIFNILNNKKMLIEDIVSNNLFLFWNSSYLIIELENEFVIKNNINGNKYKFTKGKEIENFTLYKKIEANKHES